jgi:hypothetical protein
MGQTGHPQLPLTRDRPQETSKILCRWRDAHVQVPPRLLRPLDPRSSSFELPQGGATANNQPNARDAETLIEHLKVYVGGVVVNEIGYYNAGVSRFDGLQEARWTERERAVLATRCTSRTI